MNSTGNRVLITGGSSGIGLALAQLFVAKGNQVTVVGRTAEKLEAARQACPALTVETCDVAVAQERERLVASHKDVNVLINSAGIMHKIAVADWPSDDAAIDEITINFVAPILLVRAFLPTLLAQPSGAIVNITSGLAIVPKETYPIYCATKAGLRSFTQSLRGQLQGSSVKVFELLPPVVETAMTQDRGGAKMSPEDLAAEFWRAFEHDKLEVKAGKVKVLSKINRLAPDLAQSIIRKSP